MSGRPVIHRAEIGARQDDLDLALANGDDQPVLRVVQDSASRFSRARAEPAARRGNYILKYIIPAGRRTVDPDQLPKYVSRTRTPVMSKI